MGLKEYYVSFLAITTSSTEGVVTKGEKKPVAVAEDVPSSDISLVGHSVIAFLFVSLCIAFTSFSIYAFIDRPEVEVFSQQRISNFPPLPIDITSECSNAPNCNTMTVTANWSNSLGTPCAGKDTTISYSAASQLVKPSFTTSNILLCFVGDQQFTTFTTLPLTIQGVNVDMVLNPGEADPTLKASGSVSVSTKDGRLNRLINLDTWQIKTLVLGMNVKRRDDEIVEQTLYPIAIQYDGKRPNWRATLIIALNPVANVYDLSRPGTVLDVISSIGGAASLIAAGLLLITPMFRCVFPGDEAVEVEDVDTSATIDSGDKSKNDAGGEKELKL